MQSGCCRLCNILYNLFYAHKQQVVDVCEKNNISCWNGLIRKCKTSAIRPMRVINKLMINFCINRKTNHFHLVLLCATVKSIIHGISSVWNTAVCMLLVWRCVWSPASTAHCTRCAHTCILMWYWHSWTECNRCYGRSFTKWYYKQPINAHIYMIIWCFFFYFLSFWLASREMKNAFEFLMHNQQNGNHRWRASGAFLV